MCIFLCMGGNSTTWMNTAVIVTCMRNFRQNRGPVSGILKGYLGLSSAIFTDLCSALFASNPATFLLMLTFVPAGVCVAAMFFLRESPSAANGLTIVEEETEFKCFNLINAIAVFIAVFLLLFDLSGEHGVTVSRIFAAVLLVLLAVPVGVPVFLAFKANRLSKASDVEDRRQIEEPLIFKEDEKTEVVDEEEVDDANKIVEQRKTPEIGDEHTIQEAMAKLDFWIMFVSFLCGVGTGMAVMNNMGQMGFVMGYTDVSIFVSMTSIWGFFGRIGSGSLSEYFLKKYGTPRPLWNAAAQILMTVGYVIMALALPGSLFLGSVIVGVCYGVRHAVTVPIASELFGLESYGLIYNILILNLPLGSFLFSGLLAGFLYDAEATETEGGGNTCVGAHCYRLVFIVMALTCTVGFGFDLLLAFRAKKIYRKIYASKKAKLLT